MGIRALNDDGGRPILYAAEMVEQTIRNMVFPRARGALSMALGVAAILAPLSHGARSESLGPKPGIAMLGEPALPAGFDHLPYADPGARKGGRLTVGAQGTFDSLNPFNLKAGSTAQGLNGNVFQTLMARNYDEPFTLYGLIAESIETNEDRSRVTFHINPAAKFSDGSPVTSADVRFTFDLLRTKGRPQNRVAYSLVKAVDTPDPLTITYDLSGLGDRELPLILALMPVLPKAGVDVERFSETTLAPPLASGPYTVAKVEPGQRLTLRRNPDYWAKDLPISRGLYNFDEIRIEYYRDANAIHEAFKAGLLDYREETNPTRWLNGFDFPAIRDGRDRKLMLPLGIPKGMQGFAFNTRRAVFRDVRVREALGYMFDFEWLNTNLFGGLYHRTRSFFDESELASTGRPASDRERALLARWPGAVRADILEGKWAPPVSDGSGRDRENARRAIALLKEAGYVIRDGAMIRVANGERLSFEIMVGDRAQQRLAENFAASLGRIGVDAHTRLVDEVQYQRRRQKFDFDMMPGLWLASASPGSEQRTRWGSASADQEASFNLAGARSPAIDGLIDALLAAATPEDFTAAARALDRALLSGFYIVPLFHASDQWFAYSTKLAFPEHTARFAAPLFGATLDTWWRKEP